MDKFCSCSFSKADDEAPEEWGKEANMDQAYAGTEKKKRWWRPGKRFNVTLNFSTPDAEVFDELKAGLEISFSALAKIGLHLLLSYYLLLIEGVRIKLHHPDGRITEPEILELLKLKALVKKKQDERKQ